MNQDEQTRHDILLLTTSRQFRGWAVTMGMNQSTVWAKVQHPDLDTRIQINMPLELPLEEFEAEAWIQVSSMKEHFLLTGEGNDN